MHCLLYAIGFLKIQYLGSLGMLLQFLIFFIWERLTALPRPLIPIVAPRLRPRTLRQKLYILRAAGAGSSGNPGERLLIGRRQVDHEEHSICHVLLGAWAGELLLPPAAAEGRQQLAIPLWVLQILQGDHVGQSQLSAESEAPPAPPEQEAKGAEDD